MIYCDTSIPPEYVIEELEKNIRKRENIIAQSMCNLKDMIKTLLFLFGTAMAIGIAVAWLLHDEKNKRQKIYINCSPRCRFYWSFMGRICLGAFGKLEL